MTKPATIAHPFAKTELEIEMTVMSQTHFGKLLGLTYIGFGKHKSFSHIGWDKKLLANKTTGFLHGGVITTMIDETCGGACVARLRRKSAIATIDLRVDYMRPALRGEDLFCASECYRLTKRVCFVRATVYQSDLEKPVAHGTGTFMIGAYSPFFADMRKGNGRKELSAGAT